MTLGQNGVICLYMFNQILELVRVWPALGQIFFAVIIATAITIISTVFIGCVSDFLTNGIPKILHGYPPCCDDEVEAEEEKTDE